MAETQSTQAGGSVWRPLGAVSVRGHRAEMAARVGLSVCFPASHQEPFLVLRVHALDIQNHMITYSNNSLISLDIHFTTCYENPF